MKIEAKSILSSIDSRGNRIDTVLVTYPRIIHSEIMTHRLFSRNSASSRAIPFEKMIQSVKENPFIPIAWQKEHKGMQGTEYIIDNERIKGLNKEWLHSRDNAIISAKRISGGYYGSNEPENEECIPVTKQLCNRLLEPFMWHTVLITSTEWDNFFNLRCPKYEIPNSKTFSGEYFKSKKDVLNILKKEAGYDNTVDFLENKATDLDWLKTNKGQAEIHMMTLAEAIYDCRNEAIVQQLKEDEWHIPFAQYSSAIKIANKIGYDMDSNENTEEIFLKKCIDYSIKVSVAKCARTSYTIVGDEKDYSIQSDLDLYDKLFESGHFSPFEHIAQCMTETEYYSFVKGQIHVEVDKDGDIFINEFYCTGNWKTIPEPERFGWCNNFKGFKQYRYILENR